MQLDIVLVLSEALYKGTRSNKKVIGLLGLFLRDQSANSKLHTALELGQALPRALQLWGHSSACWLNFRAAAAPRSP